MSSRARTDAAAMRAARFFGVVCILGEAGLGGGGGGGGLGLLASLGGADATSVRRAARSPDGRGTATIASQWGQVIFRPTNFTSEVTRFPHDGHVKVTEGSPDAMVAVPAPRISFEPAGFYSSSCSEGNTVPGERAYPIPGATGESPESAVRRTKGFARACPDDY